MPVSESEIWEASLIIGLATDYKHGALELGDEFWAEVPEKFMNPGDPNLAPLADLRNDQGQQIVGPSATVAVLSEAARERGLSLAEFWQELEQAVAGHKIGKVSFPDGRRPNLIHDPGDRPRKRNLQTMSQPPIRNSEQSGDGQVD